MKRKGRILIGMGMAIILFELISMAVSTQENIEGDGILPLESLTSRILRYDRYADCVLETTDASCRVNFGLDPCPPHEWKCGEVRIRPNDDTDWGFLARAIGPGTEVLIAIGLIIAGGLRRLADQPDIIG